MSQTVELLKKACELEKAAYTNYVESLTSAGIVALVQGGVAFEKAASDMQVICEADATVMGMMTSFLALEKAAEYIEELEAKVEVLEKVASDAQDMADVASASVDKDNPLNKLASIGFSQAEISMISQLPDDLIEKVASSGSTTKPWELGSAHGFAREKTDPLLEFILS